LINEVKICAPVSELTACPNRRKMRNGGAIQMRETKGELKWKKY